MGCVATMGTVPPPRTCVKCLRADAACKASLGRTPLWLVRKESRSLPPLAGTWLAAQPIEAPHSMLCSLCSMPSRLGVCEVQNLQ